jgi:hypothetical protein
MKKTILTAILYCLCFSAAAQSAVFHVSPVIGSGITEADNGFIFSLITDEIILRDYSLVTNPERADFILTGALSPYEDEHWYYDQAFIVKITLIDKKTEVLLIEQDIVYSTLEDLSGIFPSMMQSIFSLIPSQKDAEAPVQNLLYAGVTAFWSPRNYSGSYESMYFINFGGGIEAEYTLFPFLSLGLGAEVTSDWIMASANESHQAVSMGIPLLAKGFFISHSGDFLLQPYLGVQLNLSFNKAVKPSLFSGVLGFQYGVRFGPGIFYLDPRFSIDFSGSTITSNENYSFNRHIIHIGIGYKIGFFTRGKK